MRAGVLLALVLCVGTGPLGAAPPPPVTELVLPVTAGDDDAEQSGGGGMTLNSSDLDLGGPIVGLRFPDLALPPGAEVVSAAIQFTADESGSSSTDLVLRSELSAHAAPFQLTPFDLSSRPVGPISVDWSPQGWNKVGDAGNRQRTPDLAALIQQVIDAPGWEWRNALVLLIDGSGARAADSAESSAGTPVLHLEYSFVGNVAPRVRILAPVEGTEILEGEALGLLGTALDAEDGDLAASLSWSSDLSGFLGSGASLSAADLTPGFHVITAAVQDSDGALGSAQVGVSVQPNAVPQITVHSPADGDSFGVGDAIAFSANAADAEDGDLSGALSWSSSLEGVLGQGPAFTRTDLLAGVHEITVSVSDSHGASVQVLRTITVVDVDSPVVLAAGDIADCNGVADEATADLLDTRPGTVLTLGDNAYPDGTAQDYADCYDPSWGRHLARTRPSAGNHEYHTPGAAGYFGYFGAAAGDPNEGWYSFDLGSWHVVVLNSNCDDVGGCYTNSAQGTWLAADLAANPRDCTLAVWHQPRFSSGNHGDSTKTAPLWRILHEHRADVVLVGHDHDYERFAPQDADGNAAPGRGIRQFVVGTGGRSLRDFGPIAPNSEVRDAENHGVLELTLHPDRYDWEFLAVPGGSGFQDVGSAACVVEPTNSSSCGLGGELLLLLPLLGIWSRRRVWLLGGARSGQRSVA